ncbi:regulatory ArsR family protein [Thioclava sp. ES.031]|nr:regulatory ArsR family protein [Thioclava sp. ES.031]
MGGKDVPEHQARRGGGCIERTRCQGRSLHQYPDRGASGVYYPLGVALSEVYGENMKGVRVQVQLTKASVENLNLLQQGRGELAVALGLSVSTVNMHLRNLREKFGLRTTNTVVARVVELGLCEEDALRAGL